MEGEAAKGRVEGKEMDGVVVVVVVVVASKAVGAEGRVGGPTNKAFLEVEGEGRRE